VTDVPVLDSPDGALIDNLVADIIDSANRHVGIASEAIERLTSYPALAARYGDFNLGLDFHGTGGRLLRRDIHRRLLDKGMSLRQIAAQTGASHMTVQRDLVTNVTEPEPEDAAEAPDLVTNVTEPEPAPVAALPRPPDAGPRWLALRDLMTALAEFSDADLYAASVPERNRQSAAKRLRKLGEHVARIAWLLEGGSR